MKKQIFEFLEYKAYLKALIAGQPKMGRGIRSSLAKALGCQVAYVSQILNGHLHLSIEQSIKLNQFFFHNKEEGAFFILLVQLARAGDAATRSHFQEQIDEALKKRLILTQRLRMAEGISKEDQTTYYSAWYYSAIHILITIPAFQKRIAISNKIGINVDLVAEVLDFLVQKGLAKQIGDRYTPGQSQIHLDQNSKLTARSHANWRIRALGTLDSPIESDVHYTGVYSLSEKDLLKIKSLILKQIEEIINVVKPSSEEDLAVFCLDFFKP